MGLPERSTAFGVLLAVRRRSQTALIREAPSRKRTVAFVTTKN